MNFCKIIQSRQHRNCPSFYRTGILCFPVIMSRRRRAAICCYVYLLRTYIEGKNLEEYVAEDPYLRPERQLEILEEICQAVARLHAMDPVILHRDMKPQNLILDAGGHVHLIDF